MGLFKTNKKGRDDNNVPASETSPATETSSSETKGTDSVTIPDAAVYYKEQVEKLMDKLYIDPLGCKTKTAFEEEIESFVENQSFSLVVMNVNLERVNAKNGRATGDDVLKAVSGIYNKYFPNFYHIGGEKFNILAKENSSFAVEMQRANMELAKYLYDNQIDIDIYYGMVKGNEVTGSSEIRLENFKKPWQAYVSLAVERMYADKRRKRPKNINIRKEELEAERLQEALAKKEAAQQALNAKQAELEKEVAKEDAKQINEELSGFFDKLEEIQQEMNRSKDTLEQLKKEKELVDLEYIPHFPFEHDELMETMTSKVVDTMWFHKAEIEIANDKEFHKIRIMVYPTAYEKPPMTVPSLVIIEDERKRHIYSGKNISAGIANTAFTINSRFTKDGNYNVSILLREGDYKIVSRKDKPHPGVCTPYHFGKVFFDKEVFPIRKNVDGLMDCVVRTGDVFNECNGVFENNGITYQVLQNGRQFEIVEV